MIRTDHQLVCDGCGAIYWLGGNHTVEATVIQARKDKWVVGTDEKAECPACIGKAVEKVERKFQQQARATEE